MQYTSGMNKAVKKPVTRTKKSNKVDYSPNQMTFWVAAAAGSLIVLMAVMVIYS